MEAIYKWTIKEASGKPQFTDKNGIVRENVIKKVVLEYSGELGERKHKRILVCNFSLTDLSNFRNYNEFTSEEIIALALATRNPKEIEAIESEMRSIIEDIHETIFVTFEFE